MFVSDKGSRIDTITGAMTTQEVALINMPFSAADSPSIQLGLLKAIAAEHEIEIADIYANVEFAARIGINFFWALSDRQQALVGEWVFSRAAFPENGRSDALPERFPHAVEAALEGVDKSVLELRHLRDEIAVDYVSELADRLFSGGVRVACFTSTFQQNVAALALARALKQRDREIFCLFGGANHDGPMGPAYMRAFDFIDTVVVGEADEVFPEILKALRDGRPVPEMAGVVTRARLDDAEKVGRATFTGPLDRLPIPDYSSYFAALKEHGIARNGFTRQIRIPFESARGCWWGEKSHCTFCGLNGMEMGFRVKTAPVVVRELTTQAQRHRSLAFSAVDNILGPKLRADLVDELSAHAYDFEIFYEIKANLTRDQIRELRNVGVNALQPGIESLSSRLLKLMRKGIRAIQNVNTLRWTRHYGVWTRWGILYGFPGEVRDDYDEQMRVIGLIRHLQPPITMVKVRVERFTPYFTGAAAGFENKRAVASYRMIYPDALDAGEAAYLFEADAQDIVPSQQLDPLRREVELWKESWAGDGRLPFLSYRKAPDGLFIDDGRRDPERPRELYCEAPMSDIYLACMDRPQSTDSVAHLLAERRVSVSRDYLTDTLEEFEKKGLVLREDELFLSLAIPNYRAYARAPETCDA